MIGSFNSALAPDDLVKSTQGNISIHVGGANGVVPRGVRVVAGKRDVGALSRAGKARVFFGVL
jgi:hypothetical protein